MLMTLALDQGEDHPVSYQDILIPPGGQRQG